MFEFLSWYFNLPMTDIFAFGFKFLFLLMLFHISTRTTRIVYRIHIRRPLKRWLNAKGHEHGRKKTT